jgi:hypothetical protein
MIAGMRNLFFLLVVFAVGAVVLIPAISALGLDPVPGDFTIQQGNFRMAVPVTYSLCASLGLGLFMYLMKR